MTLIDQLERNVKLFSEKSAIIYEGKSISYKELSEKTNSLANFLLRKGLKKGERVGLLLKKTPEAIISFLGVAAAGGVVFPIDYNLTLSNIQFILEKTHPSFMIVDTNFYKMFNDTKFPLEDDRLIIVGSETKDLGISFETIMMQESVAKPSVNIHDEDLVYLNFTSGTTGIPKGALTTHANIYWNTKAVIETFKLMHNDIHLCMFPVFSHPHELFARALYLGGTIVLMDNIYPKSIVRVISQQKITCLMAIAALYETLVRLYEHSPFGLPSIKLAESGGMHTPPTLIRRFKEHLQVPILPVWGSTETTGVAIAISNYEEYRSGSMGKPCPNYEIKIIDEDGNELPPYEIGEMIIRGPGVCKGYFNQPDETQRCMKDGWYYTGDMVWKDSDGYFYFAARKSGMLKVAGLKVSPTEIEDVLMTHPKVSETAVVKANNHTHGEVPKAYIVLKEGTQASAAEIRKYCEERLAKYKIPRIIEFRTKLPKTPGGKILYRELQESI